METPSDGQSDTRDPCYCGPPREPRVERVVLSVHVTLWLWKLLSVVGLGPLAGARKPPHGFCGWCTVCGQPGHTRHAPDGPYTAAWCDQHWKELTTFPPDLSHQNFPNLDGREYEALFVEEFWSGGTLNDPASRLYVRVRDLPGIWLLFKDGNLYCVNATGAVPDESSPDLSADAAWSCKNPIGEIDMASAKVCRAVFSNPFVLEFTNGTIVTFTEGEEGGRVSTEGTTDLGRSMP